MRKGALCATIEYRLVAGFFLEDFSKYIGGHGQGGQLVQIVR